MKTMIKNQKGFTLIELLAVIVILGIIAAIAVPNIGGIINKTQEKAAIAEFQQVVEAARLYVAENGTNGIDTGKTLSQDDLNSYLDRTDFNGNVKLSGTDKVTYSLVKDSTVTVNGKTYKITETKVYDGTTATVPVSIK